MKKAKNVIFCFSGSGNCLDIAKTIARELGSTDIIMMRTAPVVKDVYFASTVGFVFPCYAGGFPDGMLENLKRLRVSTSSYKYGIVSYHGSSGCGLRHLYDLFDLDYWQDISGKDSTARLASGKRSGFPKSEEKSRTRVLEEALAAARNVKARKRLDGRPPAHIHRYLENRLWYHFSRKAMKRPAVTASCDGCGICEKICPTRIIHMEDGKAVMGDGCTLCVSCLQFCPKNAIDMGSVYNRWGARHNPNVTLDEMSAQLLHFE